MIILKSINNQLLPLIKKLLLLLVAIYFSACSTKSLGIADPHAITSSKVNSIKMDVTTSSELEAMFGIPVFKEEHSSSFTYFFKDLNLSSIWVKLDKSDRVISFKVSY